jgi:hypothetical protein
MKIKFSTVAAYAVVASAALIAAWKGSLDWMGLALLALVFKMPGTTWLRKLIQDKLSDFVGKKNADPQ